MRWDRLFEDLDAQLASEESRDRAAEVADRTRYERAQVDVQARLLRSVGTSPVTVRLAHRSLTGTVRDVGPDWVLLELVGDAPCLVPTAAVRTISGVAPGVVVPGTVARRFGLGSALRGISRDRSVVAVEAGGASVIGTIDVVGADHVELAEHPPDLPRRPRNVKAVYIVPFWAIESVQPLRP